MHQRILSAPHLTEPDYICVASKALSRMTSELKSLALSNRRLTLAMAAAGHDLRQRLHALLGTIELLSSIEDRSRSMELKERAKSLVFRMASELEQLASQAEQQYQFALPSPRCFALSSLLGQIKSDWESEAVAKGLRFSVGQVECQVDGEHRLLAVIMDNLVGNAVRHTDQGEVKVEPTIGNQCLTLAVSDTGPGISEEALRRSFNLSPRINELHKGMGLGLSIARKTAELLGHQFEVSTVLNRGTSVRLHISLADS
jgi:signal transduction histidine kinase